MEKDVKKGKKLGGLGAAGAFFISALLFVLYFITFESIAPYIINIVLFSVSLILGFVQEKEFFKTFSAILLMLFTLCGGLIAIVNPTIGDDYLLTITFLLLLLASNIALHSLMYYRKDDDGRRRVLAYLSSQISLLLISVVLLDGFFGSYDYVWIQPYFIAFGFILQVVVQILIAYSPLGNSFKTKEKHSALRGASIVFNVFLMVFAIFLIYSTYGGPLRLILIASLVLFGVNIGWSIEKFPHLGYIYTLLKYILLAFILYQFKDWSLHLVGVLVLILGEIMLLLFLYRKGKLSGIEFLSKLSNLLSDFRPEGPDSRGITPGFGPISKNDMPDYQLMSQQRNITPVMPSPPTQFGVKKPKRKQLNKES